MSDDEMGYTLKLTGTDGIVRLIGFQPTRKTISEWIDGLKKDWENVSEGMRKYAPRKYQIKRLSRKEWEQSSLRSPNSFD